MATALCSLAARLLPFEVLEWVALPQLLRPWTLATSVVFEGGLVPFLVTAIMLWMFGNTIEGRMGTRPFLGLYFAAGALGNLATAFMVGAPFWLGIPLGSAYSITALFVAFGHFHRHSDVFFMFLFRVNAWNLVFYGLALDLLFLLIWGHPHYLGLLVAALGSLLYFTRGRNLGGPFGDLERQARAAWARWQWKRKTRHLQVLKGGKSDPWIRDEDGDGNDDPPERPVIH